MYSPSINTSMARVLARKGPLTKYELPGMMRTAAWRVTGMTHCSVKARVLADPEVFDYDERTGLVSLRPGWRVALAESMRKHYVDIPTMLVDSDCF